MISVHVEVLPHLHRTIQAIKQLGAKAGVAINPSTPVVALEEIAGDVDHVLVMSVNPGFGGQTFIPRSESKIAGGSRPARPAGQRRADRSGRRHRSLECRPDRRGGRHHPRGRKLHFRNRRPRAGDARAACGRDAEGRGVSVAAAGRDERPRRPLSCGSATRKPTRWGWSTTRTTSCGSRWPRRSAAFARLDVPGNGAARASRCRSSKRSVTTTRPARYDDEMEVRTKGRMLSPVRMEFSYEVVRREDQAVAASGRTVHAALDPPASRAGFRSASGRCSHEGARDRRRRVHRVSPDRALLDRGAEVIGLDCFTDYYAAVDQGSEPGPQHRDARASGSSRRGIQDADLPRVLDGVTHVFHLAAQAGVRKSWGRDFRDLHGKQRRSVATAARGVRRAAARAFRVCLELVDLRRQRRDSDARGCAAAAGIAVRGHASLPPSSSVTCIT